MRKRRIITKCIAMTVIAVLCLCMCLPVSLKKTRAESKDTLADGTYTVKGFLKNASADQPSMGNSAITQPMQVVAKDGKVTLRMECKALTANLGTAKFTGYLAKLNYFPDWTGGKTGVELPKNEVAEAVKVESYYQDTYDSYNDPDKGTDENVKGKLYPHYLNLPVEYKDDEVWVQVYVPVMEGISKGSGLQYAILQIDWSTLNKTSDEPLDLDSNSTTSSVDKGGLQYLLLSANALLSHEELYTSVSITALKNAVSKAQSVYTDSDATKEQVEAQMKALSSAITGLKEKTTTSSTSSSKTTTSSKLNINKLSDGIYSITGKMLKTDKKSESMSNEAINHTIKLTVKNGKYYISLDFQGININSQFGYLSKLSYYVSGYKLDKYGVPSGKVKAVTINSYQKDKKGNKVKDTYGTNYPDKVTFPLISEALKDGYVPLQVFVPVMESISAGSGTQPVYLKLDLKSVKAVKDTSVFKSSSSNSASTSTSSSSGGSEFATSIGSDDTSSITPSAQTTQDATTTDQTQTATGTGTADTMQNTNAVSQNGTSYTAATDESDDEDTPIVVPSVMSVLVSLIGIFYKVKSRGL